MAKQVSGNIITGKIVRKTESQKVRKTEGRKLFCLGKSKAIALLKEGHDVSTTILHLE